MRFKDKRVIVTGANRSMGQKMAVDFAREGAQVVLSYRESDAGARQTVEMIHSNGGDAIAIQVDFAKMDEVKVFAEKALSYLGGFDVLVNNVGMISRETLFELTPEKMQLIFQVNAISPLYLSQLCAQAMVNSRCKGSIINISSTAASCTLPNGVVYASSKAAVNKWTQNVALNLSQYGIRVNAVAPGIIQAGMNENTAQKNPDLWDKFINDIPLKRAGMPKDISNMVMFLASDDASWVTGKIIEVDGGYVM